MYITETTSEVRKVFEGLEKLTDISKLKIILYLLELLNNNQINSKNEINPSLKNDEDMDIFNLEQIGFENDYCTRFIQYNIEMYKKMSGHNDIFEENGNILGIKYNADEKNWLSDFEKLTYNEKLDIFKELFIRYDNNTYFEENINIMTFNSEKNGFDIAREIEQFKI